MRYWMGLLLVVAVAVSGCQTNRTTGTPAELDVGDPAYRHQLREELRISVEEVEATRADPHSPDLMAERTLGDDRREALLAMLPPLVPREIAETAVVSPSPSLPVRAADARILSEWPLADARPAPQSPPQEPLRVLRHAPEGEVASASRVFLTFNQPMVDLTVTREATEVGPAEIDPPPAGRWRWLGDRTLVFEAEARLPMATDFRVTVPAGTRSQSGAVLVEPFEFHFATPPLRLVSWQPEHQSAVRHPDLLLAFNQRVDPTAVFHATSLRGAQGHQIELELIDKAEEPTATGHAQAGSRHLGARRVVLRPRKPLAMAATYVVEIAEGLSSMEGPRRSDTFVRWSFRTAQPLAFTGVKCSYPMLDSGRCRPDGGWTLMFNNRLDPKSIDAQQIRITPRVDSFRISENYEGLHLAGEFAANTNYTIRLPATIADTYGQRLGRARSVTLTTGDPLPLFAGPPKSMIVLDPNASPGFAVRSRGVDALAVRVHRVQPGDWAAMERWTRKLLRAEQRMEDLPGERLGSSSVKVAAEPSDLVETWIPLGRHLRHGTGQLLVSVQPEKWPLYAVRPPSVVLWVQATRIGLVARHDDRNLWVWPVSLADGSPQPDVKIGWLGDRRVAASDDQGAVKLPLYDDSGARLLVASRGDDVALLPHDPDWLISSTWRASVSSGSLLWTVFDNRGLYRPGELALVKGWLRRLTGDPEGDLELASAANTALRWQFEDARGRILAEDSAELSALGGFDLELRIPESANPGQARLILEAETDEVLEGSRFEHELNVEAFRPATFEVVVTANADAFEIGDHVSLGAIASYFDGGALADAAVQWQVSGGRGGFTPPGHEGWAFGHWTPPWSQRTSTLLSPLRTLSSRTDSEGGHALRIKLDAAEPGIPWRVRAQATVTDLDRQAWSGASEFIVHPGSRYVGLRLAPSLVVAGEEIVAEAIAVRPDGGFIEGAEIVMEFARAEYDHVDRRERIVDEHRCIRRSTAGSTVRCVWKSSAPGWHRVTASTVDPAGRMAQTELRTAVRSTAYGTDTIVAGTILKVSPERDEVAPGDAVRILIEAPFEPRWAQASWVRGNVAEQSPLSFEGRSAWLTLETTDAMVPGMTLDVVAVGNAPDGLPAAASGSAAIAVAPIERALSVTVEPREPVVRPRATTTLDIRVADSAGRPVTDAEVAVAVVDERVLVLSGYRLPDPMLWFYTPWEARTSVRMSHQHVHVEAEAASASEIRHRILGAPEDLVRARRDGVRAESWLRRATSMLREYDVLLLRDRQAGPGVFYPASEGSAPATDGSGGRTLGPMRPRSDFPMLVLFEPALRTNADGVVTLPLELPDSISRFRVMAVAAAGSRQFGAGESTVVARQVLSIEARPPRFLRAGDRVEMAFLVHNRSDQSLPVDVALRGSHLRFVNSDVLLSTDAPGNGEVTAARSIQVPGESRVEVRFEMAPLGPGTMALDVVAAAGDERDAISLTVPVWAPATPQRRAHYGSIDHDDPVVQPIRLSAEVWPQAGGLTVRLASTALHALEDARRYLAEFPYETTEALASRVIAYLALEAMGDGLGFHGEDDRVRLRSDAQRDVDELLARQTDMGAFGGWPGRSPRNPAATVQAAHALAWSRSASLEIPERSVNKAIDALRSLREWARPHDLPGWWTLEAHALEAGRRLGESKPHRARSLANRIIKYRALSIEAAGWVLPTLAEAGEDELITLLLNKLNNRTLEDADGAYLAAYEFLTPQGMSTFHSRLRDSAVVLTAYADLDQGNEMLEKLANGLLAHVVEGRWDSPQDAAFVLEALERYLRARERETPDFLGRAWMNGGLVADQAFRGRGSHREALEIPMSALLAAGEAHQLTLAREGRGRMYYRLGLDAYPKALPDAPFDAGLAVDRSYLPIDDEDDVRRDDDGTWRIRAGARVAVVLRLVTPEVRPHVVLIDAMPAGFEAVNRRLKSSPVRVPADGEPSPRPWFEHESLRDDRVEVFAATLRPGVYDYRYEVRATTLGRFVAPAATAEEIYRPEIRGHGITHRVIVE